MQSKSNVTVHKTPQEQKEIDQFTKERRARTEKQKAKRPSSTTSSVKKAETNVRNEEEEVRSTHVRTYLCSHTITMCNVGMCRLAGP